MSLSWMAAQPRMDEPSIPKPSSKDDSDNCSIGNETWCHSPGRSVKRRSSSLARFFLAKSSTALGSALVSAMRNSSSFRRLNAAQPRCCIECFYDWDKVRLCLMNLLVFKQLVVDRKSAAWV